MVFLTNTVKTGLTEYDIFVLCLVTFITVCTVLIVRRKKKKKIKLKEEKGIYSIAFANHVNGLPVADGILTKCTLFADRILFEPGNTQITLSLNKIADICTKTETEIQSQYVSSIGGAVGGGMLFGPLGAIVGGRAKQKKTTQISKFMIITYKKEDSSLAYISLEYYAAHDISIFVKNVKSMISGNESVTIEL